MKPDFKATLQGALAAALRLALPSAESAAVDALAADLGRRVVEIAAAPAPPHLTYKQAREQAARISDLAAELGRELDSLPVVPILGMTGRIVNGAAGLDDDGVQRLRASLSALRRDAQAMLRATGDDPRAPQAQLPRRGDRADTAARRVAHVVLWELFMCGASITTTDNGAAVQCVEAAFDLAGITADARHAVRGWVDRHPEQPAQ